MQVHLARTGVLASSLQATSPTDVSVLKAIPEGLVDSNRKVSLGMRSETYTTRL